MTILPPLSIEDTESITSYAPKRHRVIRHDHQRQLEQIVNTNEEQETLFARNEKMGMPAALAPGKCLKRNASVWVAAALAIAALLLIVRAGHQGKCSLFIVCYLLASSSSKSSVVGAVGSWNRFKISKILDHLVYPGLLCRVSVELVNIKPGASGLICSKSQNLFTRTTHAA